MRMKIFSAVLLGAALALAGCSGDGNSSSSTSGSTGTNASNGSTGSTGTTNSNATNGSSGNTTAQSTNGGSSGASTGGGTCSTNNPTGTCATPGETCQRLTKQNNSHVTQCVCTPTQTDQNGNVTAPDTCANNDASGLTVCDEFTRQCRLPQSFEEANGQLPDGGVLEGAPGQYDPRVCDFDNGFTPLPFCYFGVANGSCTSSYEDGGTDNGHSIYDWVCVETCEANDVCSTTTSCALDQPLFNVYPDGGDASYPDGGAMPGATPIGFCNINVCGPTASDDGGLLNSDFFASCDAHATGDGECLPVLTSGDGICQVANSAATDQGICDPAFLNAAPANGCPAGDLCLGNGPTAAPNETGICISICNADAPDSGVYDATCPASYANGCIAFGSDISAGLSPGECIP